MATDWAKHLTVTSKEVAGLFTEHPESNETKLRLRAFTIPFEGTQQRSDKLILCLRRLLLKYVFPERARPDDIDWAEARDKFGNIDPKSDGKLGEMLLYLFVETFLKTPLMAYKLKDLGNPNDQVKGADGVFVGDYEGQAALLIGESKIHQKLSSALSKTLSSLQRFHTDVKPFANELLIARKYPSERELDAETAAAALHLIDGTVDRILVHPVFISYDCKDIHHISGRCTNAIDAEKNLAAHIIQETDNWTSTLGGARTTYPKPFQVFLDLFFLPVEDCLQLRHAFYEMLHGHPYSPSAIRTATKKFKKETDQKSRKVRVSNAKGKA